MDGCHSADQSVNGANAISSDGFLHRLGSALPGFQFCVVGSLLWASAMALSSFVASYFIFGYGVPAQVSGIAAIYFAGGLLAFAPSIYVVNVLLPRPGFGRIVLTVVLLALGTLAMTAGVMALVYRSYFSQWHSPFLTRSWMWQQLFTVAGAVYQYLVIGLRFYMPVGFAALIVASLWANRLAH